MRTKMDDYDGDGDSITCNVDTGDDNDYAVDD